MIYYFSSASHQNIKRELKTDQLFSQWHERKLIVDTINYRKEHPEYQGKIMVDSGAFTAYTKGVTLDVDDYLKFLDEWGDELEVFVACDSVPDPNDVDASYAQKTWDNYLYMYSKLRPEIRDKLIPVFHYGEDFKWLKNMLEYTHEDGSHLAYIGLAISLEGTTNVRIKWAQKCEQIIKESSNPNVKTHAFGVGVKKVLDHINVTSTDATSWVKRAAYGTISIEDVPLDISDRKLLAHGKDHVYFKSPVYLEKVRERLKEYNMTEESIINENAARARFNILDTLDWVDKLNKEKQKAIKIKKNVLW